MRRFRLLSVVVVSAAATRAHADPEITLGRAQQEARDHAPERVVAEAALEAARTRAAVAGLRITHDPIANGRYQQPAPGQDAGDRTYGGGLEWTLDVSAAPSLRRDAARDAVSAAGYDRTSALLELDAAVANNYADLADAQRHVARATAMALLRETALHAAERMKTVGDGNQLDLDAAVLDLAAARVEAANARGDQEVARARLGRLLGRPDGSGIAVADDVDTMPPTSISDVDPIVERDPRVQAARAELDAARATSSAELRAVVPEITVGLDVDRAIHDIPARTFATMPGLTGAWNEWEVAAQLSIPLPFFDRNRGARAGARAAVLIAEAKLARVRADTRGEIVEARARLVASIDAAKAVVDVPATIERELQLLDTSLHAGGLDLVTWALQAHRLAEVGRTYDEAVLMLRRARAKWNRLSAAVR